MIVDLAVTWPRDFQFKSYLEPHVRVMEHCLRELGHTTTGAKEKPDLSIVFGAHLPYETSGIDHLRDRIVVNTERFNPWVNDDLDAYVIRLRAAREVWSLYEYDTEYLRALGIPAKTWQYGPDAVPCILPPQKEKLYDYLFVGSVTPYRAKILEDLKKRGHRVAVSTNLPEYDHARAIGASKVVLALGYDESRSYLPWPRVVWARAQEGRVETELSLPAFGSEWCDALTGTPDGQFFVGYRKVGYSARLLKEILP